MKVDDNNENNNQNDDDDNNIFLSDHNQSMRQAYEYCYDQYWNNFFVKSCVIHSHHGDDDGRHCHDDIVSFVKSIETTISCNIVNLKTNENIVDHDQYQPPKECEDKNSDSNDDNDDNNNNNLDEDPIVCIRIIINRDYHHYYGEYDDDRGMLSLYHMIMKKSKQFVKKQIYNQIDHKKNDNTFQKNDNVDSSSYNNYCADIDIIESIHHIKPYEFRYQYRHMNRPCLLRNGHEYLFPTTTTSTSGRLMNNDDNNNERKNLPLNDNNSCHSMDDRNCESQINSALRHSTIDTTTNTTPPFVCSEWVKKKTIKCTNQQQQNIIPQLQNDIIHREWFQNIFHNNNNNTLIPVIRQKNQSMVSNENVHDDDYDKNDNNDMDKNDEEDVCDDKKIMMNMSEWIQLLECNENNNENKEQNFNHHNMNDMLYRYYLKDWHFQSWWYNNYQKNNNNNMSPKSSLLLYNDSYNEYFQYDLLNSFLKRFTKGDYKFIYWGQSNTITNIHSDVLNSYSWSYNVCGTKQWTFYFPSSRYDNKEEIEEVDEHNKKKKKYIIKTIIQNTNEIMFVPSQLKHSVINLKETLSINHNWITTDNILYYIYYQCVKKEIYRIDIEMKQWNINDVSNNDCGFMTNFSRPNHSVKENDNDTNNTPSHTTNIEEEDEDWEQKENMLRGCIGLDITAFFFMILTRLVDLFQNQNEYNILHILSSNQKQQEKQQSTATSNNVDDDITTGTINNNTTRASETCINDDDFISKIFYYYYDTFQLLSMIRILYHDNDIQLQKRLTASLANKDAAVQTMNILQHIIYKNFSGEFYFNK